MAAAAKTISTREEAPSLDDRIADAFDATLSSDDLKALLDEVERTSTDAKAQSKAAEVNALDPKLRPADVAAARQQMQDADFRSKRMDAASFQLKDLHSAALSREAKQRAADEYEAAKAERDQLAKDLVAYEVHAAAIVELLDRLVRSDERLSKANASLGGATWMESAQKIARRAQHHFGVHHDSTQPDLIGGVRLPNFYKDNTNTHGTMWPPAIR